MRGTPQGSQFPCGSLPSRGAVIRIPYEGIFASNAALPAAVNGAPPHRLYNLGNHRSEDLMRFIEVLEQACGREAIKTFTEMQPGDVKETYADIEASRRDLGFEPKTPIAEGIPRFIAWYRDYYGV